MTEKRSSPDGQHTSEMSTGIRIQANEEAAYFKAEHRAFGGGLRPHG